MKYRSDFSKMIKLFSIKQHTADKLVAEMNEIHDVISRKFFIQNAMIQLNNVQIVAFIIGL